MMTTFRTLFFAMFGVAVSVGVSAQTAPPNPWRMMFDQDVAQIRSTLATDYIYALEPGGKAWAATQAAADAKATRDADLVRDAASYRAVLKEYVGSFVDPHLRVSFNFTASEVDWPGFILRYRAGAYRVALTQTQDIHVDDIVTRCDDQPVNAWVDRVAVANGLPVGLESTRVAAADLVFTDTHSPLVTRPARCVVGGREVTLAWSGIDTGRLATIEAPLNPVPDASVGVVPLGKDGVWVRLGDFMVDDPAVAVAFRKVIADAPSFRDKGVIVLDVRGNHGGQYNWFMALLRALYGTDYVDYYARARLEITPTFVARKFLERPPPGPATDDPMTPPADPELDATFGHIETVKATSGKTVYALPRPDDTYHRPARPPSTLNHARVFVLTDYNCKSSCIAFVDEMRRIPGARQIGVETGVDMRSGTPVSVRLASGNGSFTVPAMVRLGRARGENVPWVPDIIFPGDINDTEAVKRWVVSMLNDPVTKGAAP